MPKYQRLFFLEYLCLDSIICTL